MHGMKQSLQLRLGQQLTMTPQLQQAIRLLQLSTVELRTEVQQALESNLMLEAVEDSEQEDLESEALQEAPPANGAADSNGAEAGAGDDPRIPDDLPLDSQWEDIYPGGVPHVGGSETDAREVYEARGNAPETLREHLLWQLQLAPFSDTDEAIAMAIIDSVNDEGYLTGSIEDIQQELTGELEVELDEVEAVLHRIQRFDPVGVAARNLAECLLVQLQQLDADTPCLTEATALVRDHLDLLGAHDYAQLKRRLKIGDEPLRGAIELVRSLNPHPGSALPGPTPEYIVPDVIVRKQNGVWRVELNPETAPRLRINPYYASLVRRADNSQDNSYLRSHLQEARWFLKSLQSRHETLLKVAQNIVDRQRQFLEYGEEAMKPMVLRDVAEAVDMHESTVSRITTQKYMYTPRGIFEFKYFFSSHVGTVDGGECSATAIRAMIKKLVAAENPAKPLSDSRIAELLLMKQGINVARRTVAKYREAMSIPPSNQRKRLA